MQRIATFATILAIAVVSLLGSTALAHGVKEVAVAPLSPTAGEPITIKGGGLGEGRDIEIRIVGQGADIDLGEVQADDEGEFNGQLRVPASLKPGIYQIRAIGEETLDMQVTIAPAAAADTPAQANLSQSSSASSMAPQVAETAQQRPFGEAAVLVAIFGVIAALGIFFAWTARRQPQRKAA